MNNAHTAQRITAFFIDIIIVGIITSIIAFAIPRSIKYKTASDENDSIIENIFNNKMDEKEALDTFYNNKYIMEKESIPEALISVAATVGYFVIFSFLNKGQTLGKKAMHIRVVSDNDEEVSYAQLFGRALIINGCFLSIASLIIINFIKANQYLHTIGVLGFVHSAVLICTIVMTICRNDRRGLHDLIFKTKVIETK